jgi:hypothetical protein
MRQNIRTPDEILKDLSDAVDDVRSGKSGIEDQMPRLIARLEQIIDKVGSDKKISDVSESKKTFSDNSFDSISNKFDKLEMVLESVAKNSIELSNALSRTTSSVSSAAKKESLSLSESQEKNTKVLEHLISPTFRKDEKEEREKFIREVSSIEDKQLFQQIKGRLMGTNPETLSSFSEVMNNEQLLQNLGDIRRLGRLPTEGEKQRIVDAGGDQRQIKTILDEMNAGSQKVNKLNQSIVGMTEAAVANTAALGAVQLSFQASILNKPFQSATEMYSRQAQNRMDMATTATTGILGAIGAGMGSFGGVGGMMAGGAIGGSLGHAAGSYLSSLAESDSSEGSNFIRSTMRDPNISDEQMRGLRGLMGTTGADAFANMKTALSPIIGEGQGLTNVMSKIGNIDNTSALATSLGLPQLTKEDMLKLIGSSITTSRAGGIDLLNMQNLVKRPENKGINADIMMQSAQSLMYSSASATPTIEPQTALMARLGTSNSPLLAQSYSNYQNAGYSSALTTDALSQAFFGKSMDQVFSGIDKGSMTKDSMLQQLSGQFGLSTQDSARLLKDISPDLYNTVMGTSKTGESKDDTQDRIAKNLDEMLTYSKDQVKELREINERAEKERISKNVSEVKKESSMNTLKNNIMQFTPASAFSNNL